MGFGIFSDQIEKRRSNDEAALKNAYADLLSTINPSSGLRYAGQPSAGVLKDILHALKIPMSEIPEEIVGVRERLDYLLYASFAQRRKVELVGEWWKDATGCFLATTVQGEPIALLPGKISGYSYRNSEGKKIRMNRRRAREVEIDAYSYYRPLPSRKLDVKDFFSFVLQSVSAVDYFKVLILSFFFAMIGRMIPDLYKTLFSDVIPSGFSEVLPSFTGILAGLVLSTAFLGITRTIVLYRIKDKINSTIQPAMLIRVLSLPASFFKDYSPGVLASRLLNIGQLSTILTQSIFSGIITAIFSLVYITQMVTFAPSLVLPALGTLFLLVVFSLVTVLYQLKHDRILTEKSSKLLAFTYSLVAGIQKIKLAGALNRVFAKWASAYAEKAQMDYSQPFLLRFNRAILWIIPAFGEILLYNIASKSQVSPADFLAFNFSYGNVSAAMFALSAVALSFANVQTMIEKLTPIFEATPEITAGKQMVTSLSGKIELSNLVFRYEKDLRPVIDGLTLKIRSGEFVALVGKTGCGKSTLLRLLLGFEKPETGAIYLDGRDLKGLDPGSVRRCMGTALQEDQLFSGTIVSNILYSSPDKTLEDAWKAAEMVGFDEEIRSMPMGMFTMVTEGGGGFSGGQRQLLLIARALVSNPKILIFDEATSALDNIVQKKLTEQIAKLKCTRIVIAHRLSTIRDADRIIVMDSGKIAEEGTYEQLLAKQGLFYELAKRQKI